LISHFIHMFSHFILSYTLQKASIGFIHNWDDSSWHSLKKLCTRNFHWIERSSIRCKFLVPETCKHSRPIKPPKFGRVHDASVQVCCKSFLSVVGPRNDRIFSFGSGTDSVQNYPLFVMMWTRVFADRHVCLVISLSRTRTSTVLSLHATNKHKIALGLHDWALHSTFVTTLMMMTIE